MYRHDVKYELVSVSSPTDSHASSQDDVRRDSASSSNIEHEHESLAVDDDDSVWFERVQQRTRRVIRQRNIASCISLALSVIVVWQACQTSNRPSRFVWNKIAPSIARHELPSKRFRYLTTGDWVPPPRPWTVDDCVREWGMRPQGLDSAKGRFRSLQVASFRWRPTVTAENSAASRQWDAYEFVKRAFNSRHGFVLLGDSVTQQSYEALGGQGGLLRLASPTLELNTTSYDWLVSRKVSDVDGDYGLFIKNNTRMKRFLINQMPHIPVERFDRPFVRSIRSDLLLMPEQIDRLAQDAYVDGKRLQPEVGTSVTALPWDEILFGDLSSNAQTWSGQQNSVFLINTGAHWNPICTGLMSNLLNLALGRAVASQAEPTCNTFVASVDLTRLQARETLDTLLAKPDIDLIYRTTSMAHPGCDNAILPTSEPLPFVDHPDHPTGSQTGDDWHWSTFGSMNQIWIDEIDKLAPRGQLENGNRVAVLDVAELTSKRPDAHASSKDCLHWALPSVPATWIKLASQVMFEMDS
ncbi:hypothetical protein OIV83_004219 [Microbotryomycetes sp. JL201]|nr:hypothetical protein OIV83_004219 [Microbotryomycetes sp. JL201]